MPSPVPDVPPSEGHGPGHPEHPSQRHPVRTRDLVAPPRSDAPSSGDGEPQSLADTVSQILEEARMILPGVQTLFGFQLIVVFNQRFQDRLSPTEQRLHLIAMALIAVAAGLLMAPAAYHRRAEPESVSRRFVRLSTRLLAWSTYPLLAGIVVDFYLVATLITADDILSLVLAALLFLVLALLWLVLPRSRALQDMLGR